MRRLCFSRGLVSPPCCAASDIVSTNHPQKIGIGLSGRAWWPAQHERRELLQEMREAGLVATAALPQPPAVTARQLNTLAVLDAVCHESLRLMPPVPGSVRKVTRDMVVRMQSRTRPVGHPRVLRHKSQAARIATHTQVLAVTAPKGTRTSWPKEHTTFMAHLTVAAHLVVLKLCLTVPHPGPSHLRPCPLACTRTRPRQHMGIASGTPVNTTQIDAS